MRRLKSFKSLKSLYRFVKQLAKKANQDTILELSNGLTLRVLMAFFPFILFLMSLLGFLELDNTELFNRLYGVLPPDIYNLINRFINEVFKTQNTGLLSTSLFFTVFNTANGFLSVMTSLNKAYDLKDNRHILKKVGVSLLLMLTFSLSLVLMLILLIFSNSIHSLLDPHLTPNTQMLYRLINGLVSLVVLTLAVMIMYKLACVKCQKLMDVVPGAIVTVLLWVLCSKAFSFFITNYANYSVLYGSIAGVFISILWLNLISLVLLIGNEINSMLVITA
jgi:membrane protein